VDADLVERRVKAVRGATYGIAAVMLIGYISLATKQPQSHDYMALACLSNMKRLTVASLMYSQDNNDRLPPAERWADAIKPLMKQDEIFRCPPSQTDREFGIAFVTPMGTAAVSAIPSPDREVLLYDSADWARNAHGLGRRRDRARHDNVAYVSGRVKSLGPFLPRAQ
jgi:hypothetical protein